ncbi:HET-domain-containing protein [Microthyrium microscopicum]|uniref:HET-domain-containing protein n=1 Tax=Microthyrium microscopicum TaxID=703497 RepID=A0A6A6U1P8_9PEZI|nr:HET-domain-containing protein [Microthyrium microscopicum]
MALAQYWLNECSSKHELCNSHVDSSFMPTRMLYVGATKSDYVRLHCSNVQDRGTKYCTLSHTWGGVKDALTLLSTNLTTLQQGISLSSLPKTFRDAVTIVQALNIQYLWIDSICIMQDSVEDWTSEAALMGSVYANSACTIMASAAKGPHDGLFAYRDPLAFFACKVAGSLETGTFASCGSTSAVLLGQSHLNSRGWIKQERILSPRMLNFETSGISWSCLHGTATENERDDDARDCSLRELEMYAQTGSLDDKLFLDRFDRYWKNLISLYSYCEFTNLSDKLIALSAIVQRLQKASGYMYFAGMWSPTLMGDLLWSSPYFKPRPSEYRAPSWSWASIEGWISFPNTEVTNSPRTEPMAKFLSCECTTHPLDIFKTGKVLDAQLRLSAKLRPWKTGLGKIFNSSHDLLLREKSIGEVKPDCVALDLQDIHLKNLYLCPLEKYVCRSGQTDDGSYMSIKGLAVLPHAGGSNHYERIGTFALHSTYHYTWADAESLLDSYPTQDIVLR